MTGRALLIGSPQLHRSRGALLGVARDIDTADELLTPYGFDCRRLLGPAARRDAILGGLEELARVSGPDDAVVFYFSGHGGQVTNSCGVADLRSATREPRYHQYLVPEDYFDHDDEFHGVLDIELSYAVARIAERTRNVTVILDCCHSGGMVRTSRASWIKALDPTYLNRDVVRRNRLIQRRLDELRARLERDGAPRLDPDTHPDVVRIEATDADHFALELRLGDERQGALTLAWKQAVERYRGQPVSWRALCEELNARLVLHTQDSQRANFAGPLHRLPFSLDEAPAPGALPVVRRGKELSLGGGTLYGITPGSRFVVVPAAATRADLDQALAEVKVVAVSPSESRIEVVTAVADAGDWLTARAFPLEPKGAWTGVAIAASPPVRAELARCIEATRSLRLCRPADDPVATIVEITSTAGPMVEIHDRVGCRVGGPLPPGPAAITVVQRLQRAAVLREQESGRGEHALHTPVELRVDVNGADAPVICRHADGRTTRVAAPIEVRAGTEVRCDVVNCAPARETPPRIVHLTVFHIDVDGRVVRRSESAPTGISLWPAETESLETRSHASGDAFCLDWPRGAARTHPGLRSVIVVAGDKRHTLPGLDTCELDAYSATLTPSVLDLALVAQDASMTRGATEADRELRYAVLRVDFLVVPGDLA